MSENINDIEEKDGVQTLLRKLDLLCRTGAILMESNADSPRIFRNLERAEAFLGLPQENVHVYLNYNIIMINISDSHHSFSKYQRCPHHCVEMSVISRVSKMLWQAIKRIGALTVMSRN